jgi:hypothetical protein
MYKDYLKGYPHLYLIRKQLAPGRFYTRSLMSEVGIFRCEECYSKSKVGDIRRLQHWGTNIVSLIDCLLNHNYLALHDSCPIGDAFITKEFANSEKWSM